MPRAAGGGGAAWLPLSDNRGAMGLSLALFVCGVSLAFLKMPLLSADSLPDASCEK